MFFQNDNNLQCYLFVIFSFFLTQECRDFQTPTVCLLLWTVCVCFTLSWMTSRRRDAPPTIWWHSRAWLRRLCLCVFVYACVCQLLILTQELFCEVGGSFQDSVIVKEPPDFCAKVEIRQLGTDGGGDFCVARRVEDNGTTAARLHLRTFARWVDENWFLQAVLFFCLPLVFMKAAPLLMAKTIFLDAHSEKYLLIVNRRNCWNIFIKGK